MVKRRYETDWLSVVLLIVFVSFAMVALFVVGKARPGPGRDVVF